MPFMPKVVHHNVFNEFMCRGSFNFLSTANNVGKTKQNRDMVRREIIWFGLCCFLFFPSGMIPDVPALEISFFINDYKL